MLVNGDAKALEIVGAAFLSQDKILCEEIISGVDLHSKNQAALGLPSRLIAKIFVFRLIYGGTAYAYSVDPDFKECNFSAKRWQEIIDEFYAKYQGLANWHRSIVQEATRTGRVVMPTGRVYEYYPSRRGSTMEWPRTQILNYPVQGLGADLMSIFRVSFRARFDSNCGKLISSVHDSLVVDTVQGKEQYVVDLMHNCMEDVPKNFERLFKVPFNLPMVVECQVGPNMDDMVEWKKAA